jgi:hypothetical protein
MLSWQMRAQQQAGRVRPLGTYTDLVSWACGSRTSRSPTTLNMQVSVCMLAGVLEWEGDVEGG